MVKLQQKTPDVIELRRGFGLGQAVGGLALIACGACAFWQYPLYAPSLLPGMMVAGAAFVLAGLYALLLTDGVRIDRSSKTAQIWWGPLVPIRRTVRFPVLRKMRSMEKTREILSTEAFFF